MSDLLSAESADGVTRIKMDDGKVNALGVPMLSDLHAAFEAAEERDDIVVLSGREGLLSGGFDLKSIAENAEEMLRLGGELAERMLKYPRPVIGSCGGNAIAMGSFLLLSCDYRIGVRGDYKLGFNEVAIGLTVPWFGIAIASQRLTKTWFDRCLVTGELLGPEDAQTAGILDEVVEPDQLGAATEAAVERLKTIHRDAHANSKLRIRKQALEDLREGIEYGSGYDW